MKAVHLVKYGDPLEGLRYVEIPEPAKPKANEVLVEVEFAPINISDLLLARKMYAVQPDLPSVIGNEGAGIVVSVGDAVTGIKVNDHVAISRGAFTWAERILAHPDNLVVLPKGIDEKQASMLSINPPAALLLLEEFVKVQAGEWILQNSANSGVGRAVIAFARAKGIKTVNLVRRPELVSELIALGADVVLVSGSDTAAEVSKATNGAVIRLGLDGVSGDGTNLLSEILGWDSRIVNYAAPSKEPLKVSPFNLVFKHLSVHPFFMYYPEYAPKITQHIQAAADLVASGQLRVPVAKIYTPEEITQAVEHVIAGGKVLLDLRTKQGIAKTD
jgi:NADPH:quinone reductase-like Zn-dependent oxidoreductase